MRELLLKLKKKLLFKNGSIIYSNGTTPPITKNETQSSSGNIIIPTSRSEREFGRILEENESLGLDTTL